MTISADSLASTPQQPVGLASSIHEKPKVWAAPHRLTPAACLGGEN